MLGQFVVVYPHISFKIFTIHLPFQWPSCRLLPPPQLVTLPPSPLPVAALALAPLSALGVAVLARLVGAGGQAQTQRGTHDPWIAEKNKVVRDVVYIYLFMYYLYRYISIYLYIYDRSQCSFVNTYMYYIKLCST